MMYTLRFDVETLIIATSATVTAGGCRLRFDVETLIIATAARLNASPFCCGLM